MGRSKAGHAVTNLLLLLLIAGLYLGTTQPQTISVSAPVYRGQAEGKIALQFAVSWDAGALGGYFGYPGRKPCPRHLCLSENGRLAIPP